MNAPASPTTITAQPGTPFLEFERAFDADVDQVFRAFTEPELVAQWLGPRRYQIRVDRYDARTGGAYRYRHIGQEGDEHAFRGVFHTVVPNELIIQTFEYEGFPNSVAIESMTFTGGDGRTVVNGRGVFPTLEALEGAMANGMQAGMLESYERLGELLAR